MCLVHEDFEISQSKSANNAVFRHFHVEITLKRDKSIIWPADANLS